MRVETRMPALVAACAALLMSPLIADAAGPWSPQQPAAQVELLNLLSAAEDLAGHVGGRISTGGDGPELSLAVTAAAEHDLNALVARTPHLPVEVVVVDRPTAAQTMRDLADLRASFADQDITASVAWDGWVSPIEVAVDDAAHQSVLDIARRLDVAITLTEPRSGVQPAAATDGGTQLVNPSRDGDPAACTSSFGVYLRAEPMDSRGIATAAHCLQNLPEDTWFIRHDGVRTDLNLRAEHFGTDGDMAVFDRVGLDLPALTGGVHFGSSEEDLARVLGWQSGGIALGQTLCMYGRATAKQTCGEVTAVSDGGAGFPDNVDNLLRIEGVEVKPGDSGGPVFLSLPADGVLAVGMISVFDPNEDDDGTTTVWASRIDALPTIGVDSVIGLAGGARNVADTCDTSNDAFVDDNGNVHEDNINCVFTRQIARGVGDGNFDPTGNLTIGQTASFVVRTLETAGVNTSGRTDRCGDGVHDPSLSLLIDWEILAADSCQAAGQISRNGMAVIVAGAIQHANRHQPAIEPAGFFDDTDADWVNRLAALRIIAGVGERTYAPDETLTRAQMATFLARTLDLLENGLTD